MNEWLDKEQETGEIKIRSAEALQAERLSEEFDFVGKAWDSWLKDAGWMSEPSLELLGYTPEQVQTILFLLSQYGAIVKRDSPVKEYLNKDIGGKPMYDIATELRDKNWQEVAKTIERVVEQRKRDAEHS